MPVHARNESARALGAALRGRRMARGMSLRGLAKQVGLTAHGTLVDYEHGRRIPPEDLVLACEKALEVDDGQLRLLRLAALSERADEQAAALLTAPEPAPAARLDPEPVTPTPLTSQTPPAALTPPVANGSIAFPVVTAPPWWTWRKRLWSGLAIVVTVVAAGLAVAAFGHGGQPTAVARRAHLDQGKLRFGFETRTERWGIFWGQHKATGEVVDTMHYEGAHCYLVTTTGASQRNGYVAFGTTHGVETLHSGVRITMHLWTSYPRNGVRFFVYDSVSKAVFAPETAYDGSELPVSGGTEWSALTWTVPPVDSVHGIGVQLYAENEVPRVLAIDAVSW